jgi:hypothetical protein
LRPAFGALLRFRAAVLRRRVLTGTPPALERRLIASPRGSGQGTVDGQTSTLEAVGRGSRNRSLSGCAMSAMGQKQTRRSEITMSALPPKADMAGRQFDVR